MPLQALMKTAAYYRADEAPISPWHRIPKQFARVHIPRATEPCSARDFGAAWGISVGDAACHLWASGVGDPADKVYVQEWAMHAAVNDLSQQYPDWYWPRVRAVLPEAELAERRKAAKELAEWRESQVDRVARDRARGLRESLTFYKWISWPLLPSVGVGITEKYTNRWEALVTRGCRCDVSPSGPYSLLGTNSSLIKDAGAGLAWSLAPALRLDLDIEEVTIPGNKVWYVAGALVGGWNLQCKLANVVVAPNQFGPISNALAAWARELCLGDDDGAVRTLYALYEHVPHLVSEYVVPAGNSSLLKNGIKGLTFLKSEESTERYLAMVSENKASAAFGGA